MKRVQLVVTRFDNTIGFYPVDDGWKIDRSIGCIVIGTFPRDYIPMDNVASFRVETYAAKVRGEQVQPEPEPGWITPETVRDAIVQVAESWAVTMTENDEADGRTATPEDEQNFRLGDIRRIAVDVARELREKRK